MIKGGALHIQSPNVCVDSYRAYLIVDTKGAPPQWIGALEEWCRNAPKQEQSKRLEAAKRVLQQYANPQNITLDLSRFELTALPPGLWHLANLQELNVSKNFGLRKFPDDLGQCVALRSIDASSCSINKWPACLSKLPSLERLLLDDNPGLCVFSSQIRQCRALKNLSMEATRPSEPSDFNDPRNRRLLPGEAQGRAIVRSAPSSPKGRHDSFRTRGASPPDHATAPSLSSLLGFGRAHQLDKDFGSLQWPRGSPNFPAIKPWEFDAAGVPLMRDDRIFVSDKKGHFPNLSALLDLEKLKTGEKKYMWAIGKSGNLIISEEMPAGVNKNGEPQYIGHPSLVGGGRARISGELLFEADPNKPLSGKFYINNVSGRFSQFADRDGEKLKNAARLFRRAGLAVAGAVYLEPENPQPVAGLQSSEQVNRSRFGSIRGRRLR